LENRLTAAQTQHLRHGRRGAQAFAVDDLSVGRTLGVALGVVGFEFEEPKLHLLFGVRGDKCPFALAANQQVLFGQFIDRLAYRALADFVPRSQFKFTGDRVAWFPFAGLQALQYQGLDLLIKRAERCRNRCVWWRKSGCVFRQ